MSQANSIVAHKARKGQTLNPLKKLKKLFRPGPSRRNSLNRGQPRTAQRSEYLIEDPTGLRPSDYVGKFCARTGRLVEIVPVSEVVV